MSEESHIAYHPIPNLLISEIASVRFFIPQRFPAHTNYDMPIARKRQSKEKQKEEEKRQKKQKTEEESEESEEDDADDSEDEVETAGAQELEWFSLEGCDPEPEDAAGVARLLRHGQLPPWAPAGAAAAVAERLTATVEGRRFASVVKQCIPDASEGEGNGSDSADAEDDEDSVLSVLGIVDVAAVPGLRESLGAAAPPPPLMLLVKARAQELPPELSLPQLEALQAELAKTKSRHSRLLLISPSLPVGRDGDTETGAETAVFAEDEILQSAAGLDGWKVLQPPAGRDNNGDSHNEALHYRACLLDANRLPRAIELLKQEVGGRLRPS